MSLTVVAIALKIKLDASFYQILVKVIAKLENLLKQFLGLLILDAVHCNTDAKIISGCFVIPAKPVKMSFFSLLLVVGVAKVKFDGTTFASCSVVHVCEIPTIVAGLFLT